MTKKALLLMLFFMFISTNAVSQVSCGAYEAAAVDQDCLDDREEICEGRMVLRQVSCPLEKEECEDIARFREDRCMDDVRGWDICVLSGGDFDICMLEAMAADEACSSQAKSDKNTCYWVELHCNYEVAERYLDCWAKALSDCEEDPEVPAE